MLAEHPSKWRDYGKVDRVTSLQADRVHFVLLFRNESAAFRKITLEVHQP